MKPVLYDAKGRATHFEADDGKVYRAVDPTQFAEWDGNPTKIIPLDKEPFLPDYGLAKTAPEVVAVQETLSPGMLERARKMKRLGGGPLYKAERAAEARKKEEAESETARAVKLVIDGIRTRPVA